ncbi:MAG: hypothetical protein M3R55_05950 [Acidobacteriota bacterium]|nr:hypothetical protein [Acidobacteriota bacterium]
MLSRGFKDAVEDARGVLAVFTGQTISDDDCVSDVRRAIGHLNDAIDSALMRAQPGELEPADRQLVELRARELVLLWDRCGSRTQSLLLDMKNLFGRYIALP